MRERIEFDPWRLRMRLHDGCCAYVCLAEARYSIDVVMKVVLVQGFLLSYTTGETPEGLSTSHEPWYWTR